MLSMAVAFFSSPAIPVQKSGPAVKPAGKRLMLQHSQITVKKAAPALLVKSSSKNNRVFENRSEGIICYIDDSGEIVCEGYDEGPRFHQQCPRRAYNSRDAEIINLLQQRLLQIVNGGGDYISTADNNVIPVKDDFF